MKHKDSLMDNIKSLQQDWDMIAQDWDAIKKDFPFYPQKTKRRKL